MGTRTQESQGPDRETRGPLGRWRGFGWSGEGAGFALAGLELRNLTREPLLRAQLIVQTGFLVLPLLLGFAFTPTEADAREVLGDVLLAALAFSLVVVETSVLFNMFGIDGDGLRQLFLAPVKRHRIVAAKNLVHLGLFGTVNTAILGLVAVVLPTAYGLAAEGVAAAFGRALVLQASLLVLAASVGNWTSVLFPVRMGGDFGRAARGTRARPESLSRLVLRGVAVGALLVAFAPIALVVSLPATWDSGPWITASALAGAAMLVGAIHAGSIWSSGRLLARREDLLVRRIASA